MATINSNKENISKTTATVSQLYEKIVDYLNKMLKIWKSFQQAQVQHSCCHKKAFTDECIFSFLNRRPASITARTCSFLRLQQTVFFIHFLSMDISCNDISCIYPFRNFVWWCMKSSQSSATVVPSSKTSVRIVCEKWIMYYVYWVSLGNSRGSHLNSSREQLRTYLASILSLFVKLASKKGSHRWSKTALRFTNIPELAHDKGSTYDKISKLKIEV